LHMDLNNVGVSVDHVVGEYAVHVGAHAVDNATMWLWAWPSLNHTSHFPILWAWPSLNHTVHCPIEFWSPCQLAHCFGAMLESVLCMLLENTQLMLEPMQLIMQQCGFGPGPASTTHPTSQFFGPGPASTTQSTAQLNFGVLANLHIVLEPCWSQCCACCWRTRS
jgi:hypothetical protein